MTGDNLVDRSLDLCKEAFKLIAYDPLQGTHPALGAVDHVSSGQWIWVGHEYRWSEKWLTFCGKEQNRPEWNLYCMAEDLLVRTGPILKLPNQMILRRAAYSRRSSSGSQGYHLYYVRYWYQISSQHGIEHWGIYWNTAPKINIAFYSVKGSSTYSVASLHSLAEDSQTGWKFDLI